MPKKKRERWCEFKARADERTAELNIFGPIGGGFFAEEDAVTGKRVAEQLDGLPDSVDTIRVFVNSTGGNVSDAQHIFNLLVRQHEERGRNIVVEIEAMAASAATVITSGGNTIRMPRNALMMIHKPHTLAMGHANDFRGVADALDRVGGTIVAALRRVSHLAADTILDMMNATTWMNADEALANGFITEITEPVAAAAFLDADAIAQLGEIPEKYRDRVAAMVAAQDDISDPPDDDAGDKPNPAEAILRNIRTGITKSPANDTDSNDQDESASADQAREKMDPKETQTSIDTPDASVILAEERKRRSQIDAAADSYRNIPGLDHAKIDIAARAAGDSGDSVDKYRASMQDVLVALPANTDGPPEGPDGRDIVAGEDEHDKRRRGISAGLLARTPSVRSKIEAAAEKYPKHPAFQDLDFDGAEFRNRSLLGHIKADLEIMKPGSTGRMSGRALLPTFAAAAGQQTTSDFSVGLEVATNQTLLAAYLIAQDTWRDVCGISEVSDFRAANRYRTGFIASLDQIFESGEFTSKTIPDAVKETIQALTYGNMVGLSRQAIVNDELGMFLRIAAQVGRAAALTIEAGFYTSLALNSDLGPDMNDGTALFDATHNNLGAGAAISAAAIDADATVMEAQQDSNSQEFLNVRPSVLLVPRGLKGVALTLNESQFAPDTAESNKPNIVLGLFDKVVATARLSGTRRYMFADPSVMPCFEVAFLNGEQEPFMEMREGWGVDGIEWKVRHDFGISAVEFRAGLTDAGA